MFFIRALCCAFLLVGCNVVYTMQGLNIQALLEQLSNIERDEKFNAMFKYESGRDGDIGTYAENQFCIKSDNDPRVDIIKNRILLSQNKKTFAGLYLIYLRLTTPVKTTSYYDPYLSASCVYLKSAHNLQKTVMALNGTNNNDKTVIGRKCVRNAIRNTQKSQPLPMCATNANLWIANHSTDTWLEWDTLIARDGTGDYTSFKNLLNGDYNKKSLRLEFSYRK